VTWKTLWHPNILSLIGVMMSETQFAMVSDWMGNGNLSDFVKAHPDVNRLELVRFMLMALLSSLQVY
jgi:serine/threonine protein kinase